MNPVVRKVPALGLALTLAAFAALAACNTDDGVQEGGSGTGRATAVAPAQPSSTSVTAVTATSTATALPAATATTQPTDTPAATASPDPSQTPDANTSGSGQAQPLKPLALERAFAWSAPGRPTHLKEVPDGSGRILISEQSGRIIELTGDPTAADGTERVVLDIRNHVTGHGAEEGLLGFALHPRFAEGEEYERIFLNFSAINPLRSIVSEFTFLPDGTIDPTSEREILVLPQPHSNHNGGMLEFGPDGFLYMSFGDGGGAGDRSNNGQDTSTLLGTILRIDIDAPGQAYAIPPDNPFAQGGGAPEIWAYGLRNPWRFSFDSETGDLWAGDVGQNAIEEVDLIVRGGNYGWRLKEGPECFNPSSGCEQDDLIDPVISYTHSEGCSVTGGYVYRGERLPSLYGAYIYADFCTGIIWGLRYADGVVQEQMILADTQHQIPAFGQTLDGEVYVLTYSLTSQSRLLRRILRFVEE